MALLVLASDLSHGIEANVGAIQIAECEQAFRNLNPGNGTLQARSVGILVFPKVGKGEQPGLNSEFGRGVLQVGGKTVAQYSVETPTKSPTLGVAYHRLVILFMTKESMVKFQNSNPWKVSDDVGMVIVTTGRRGDYDQSALKKHVLGFVFGEQGFFDNLYLNGSVFRRINQ